MKTIKSLLKAIKGDYLEPSDQRRIDSFLLELKCGVLTLMVVVLIVILLITFGAFNDQQYIT